MFSSSFAAGCPSVHTIGIRFLMSLGRSKQTEYGNHCAVRSQLSAAPLMTPFCAVRAFGLIRARFVPRVGSVPTAPQAEMNVPDGAPDTQPGMVSAVPVELSCT